MAQTPVEIRTYASVQDVADAFRHSMRVSWLSENITGAGTQFESPRSDVFSDIETDRPDFAVVAILGGRGAELQKSAVHMSVWDRGEFREIELLVGKSLAALGIKAKAKMRKFAATLQQMDPQLQCVGL